MESGSPGSNMAGLVDRFLGILYLLPSRQSFLAISLYDLPSRIDARDLQ